MGSNMAFAKKLGNKLYGNGGIKKRHYRSEIKRFFAVDIINVNIIIGAVLRAPLSRFEEPKSENSFRRKKSTGTNFFDERWLRVNRIG